MEVTLCKEDADSVVQKLPHAAATCWQRSCFEEGRVTLESSFSSSWCSAGDQDTLSTELASPVIAGG